MKSTKLLPTPMYDPDAKIRDFKENFNAVKAEVLRTGIPFRDLDFSSEHYYIAGDNSLEWKRIAVIHYGPRYFIKDVPKRFDALQGEMGDCWLIGAMAALTRNTSLVNHVVPPNQSFGEILDLGAFHFRIWRLGTWYDVVVDDYLPVKRGTKNLKFARSRSGDVFWACLLEKAYVKVCGGDYRYVYEGHASEALQDFSGGITEFIWTNVWAPLDVSVKWYISQVYFNGALMCASSTLAQLTAASGIFAFHTYSITNVLRYPDDDPDYPGLYLIRVLNPHGFGEWLGEWRDDYNRWNEIDREIRGRLDFRIADDGEFWMSENDFIQHFNMLHVSFLGPMEYESSRQGEYVKTWKMSSWRGEWVKNISAGGMEIYSRHLNPQYRFEVLAQDDGNNDGKIQVIIELSHMSKIKKLRGVQRHVLFHIYSFANMKYEQVPKPLTDIFIIGHRSLNTPHLWRPADIHQYPPTNRTWIERWKLLPGKYCIIPSTEYRNDEAQFLLRMWSENHVQMWEYDVQISKSSPNKEENIIDTEDWLKEMFHDLADSQDEIDWVALKKILDKSVNTNQSYFAIFKTCYRLIWGFLEIFLPSSSNDDCGAGERFSKDACRSMIAMFDDDRTGKLNYTEFSNLWNKISVWTEVYNRYIAETEGCMKVSQLREALSSIGYNINKKIIHALVHLYADEQENITLVDFILCGVSLETGISLYQKMDESEDTITFSLEDWVKTTLLL